ncbi:MAG: YqeG family HAD IIIA-type phosphatase [Clostridiales bacterium]|nr:YqeG family HAD IIIA-type phosphatase [Clostridiales bacterium]
MFKIFYPNEWKDSSYEIDYEQLAKMGIKGILFDIDNTLVPHGMPATQESIALLQRIHQTGLATCLISNNQEPRVAPFAEAMESDYLCNAHKPSVKGYQKACSIMGIQTNEAIFVGDQLFTDIYGANRAGIRSILVKPIHPKEEIQIVLKRYLEKIVLFFYRHGGSKKVPRIFTENNL